MSDKNTNTIDLPSVTTVRDLAKKVDSSPIQVIKVLMTNGVMANINQQIDFDTAAVVAAELGFEASLEIPEAKEEVVGEIPLWRQVINNEDSKNLVERPPLLRSLVMLTTAKQHCWTRSGIPMSPVENLGGSPSTLAPIRLFIRRKRSHSWTHPDTLLSQQCAPEAHKVLILSFSLLQLTMA